MFGFIKNLLNPQKDFKVTIVNTGQTFEVNGKINLLRAALNAGIEWPNDCRVGSCGACRCTLKSGSGCPNIINKNYIFAFNQLNLVLIQTKNIT